MGRPAKFRFFTCPSCAAVYQVVKAEAGSEPGAGELNEHHRRQAWDQRRMHVLPHACGANASTSDVTLA
jgi:hypothetical protein